MRVSNVRLSFPNIFRPSAFAEGQEKKFSATFILSADDPQVEKLKKEINRVATDKWGEIPRGLKIALRDGAEKDMDGFGEGTVFFNASNSVRPGVYDKDTSPLVEEDGKPYAGCYVNAMVDFWAQDNQYGKRINASLSGLQFARDGESFGGGGRIAAANDFDVVEDEDDDFLA